VDLAADATPDLPHQLNGDWDGLGQCIAEMYATRKKFEQDKVYGIITDGEVWEFLLFEGEQLLIHSGNCHISNVTEIIGNIGYIAKEFASF